MIEVVKKLDKYMDRLLILRLSPPTLFFSANATGMEHKSQRFSSFSVKQTVD